MVVVSGNAGSAPLIGSKVIQDLFGVKRGLESKVQHQIRRKLRPVRHTNGVIKGL